MQEHEQAAIVRQYYDLVDSRKYSSLFQLFTDDVVYDRPGRQTIRGLHQFREFYLADRIIESGRHIIDTLLSQDDWVAVRGSFDGCLKSGERVTVQWADFHKFRGSKICHRQTYFADRTI